jgi:acetyl esterase/lipase
MKHLLPLVMATIAGSVLAQTRPELIADVVYQKIGDRELKLDCYPVQPGPPAPALVWIHGGGWQQGTKAQRPDWTSSLLAAGIAVVSIDYRLSDEAKWPAQGADCLRAVQFVRHKAKDWNIDPHRIAVGGNSAGGHLALWVGLHADAANPAAAAPVERESSRVCAIVNQCGPADFHLLKTVRHGHPAYLYLLGVKEVAQITESQLNDVSPVAHVSPDDPPVLILHGTADTTVPVAHAKSLVAALVSNRVPHEVHLFEGVGHGVGGAPGASDRAVAFLKKHLLPASHGGQR